VALEPGGNQSLGDVLTVAPRQGRAALSVSGPFADMLPDDSGDNLVLHAARLFGEQVPAAAAASDTLGFELVKGVPVGSGLGSSAASAVAALLALNLYYGRPLSDDAMVQLAGALEGSVSGSVHYDNVAPAICGGLQLMTGQVDHPCVSLPFFDHWRVVVVYPGFTLSTRQARAVLPEQVPLRTAIQFGRNLACFVHAVYAGDEGLAAAVLRDVLAEPHRRRLVPGFDAARDGALAAGALACGLSGAGPTLFAMVRDEDQAEPVLTAMKAPFSDRQSCFGAVCRLDTRGARQI